MSLIRHRVQELQVLTAIAAVVLVLVLTAGCRRRGAQEAPASPQTQTRAASESNDVALVAEPARADTEIPRFGANSPFVADYKLPSEGQEKRLWAKSFLWERAPEFVVEQWLTSEPDRQGKYVLIEFWATWCGPCRRSIPVLNEIHRRFGDRVVVIGVSDEPRAKVVALAEPRIDYALAIDTAARMKKALEVVGIPHAIVIEPDGYVVWEGYPLLEGHELTADVVGGLLRAGRTRSVPRK